MLRTFSRSFKLLKESYSVLEKDKEIMLFPFMSIGVMIILIASAVLVYLNFSQNTIGPRNYDSLYLFFFLDYLAIVFASTFFNACLITCAHIRLNGGDPTIRDGIKNGIKNFWRILLWSLTIATVSLIISSIEHKFGLVGKIVSFALDISWNVVTYLALPIIIFEETNIVDSLKRTALLFKKTWGENLVGQLSLSGIFVLLELIGTIVLVIGLGSTLGTEGALIILGLVLVYLLGVGIIFSSLDGIFKAALYNYAVTGKVPDAFSAESITNSFKPK